MDITPLLEKSAKEHSHLCPRQILGVRIGLAGLSTLGFCEPPMKKELLVISETDGCFVDGVIAATGCTVGHRTLRVEDYGKVAATFVEVDTGHAVRVAPKLDVRERACSFAFEETGHYSAQMQAYQSMSDEEMLTLQEVILNMPVAEIVSRPGIRVNCDICGEEIMNEREVHQNGLVLCLPCAKGGYYRLARAGILDASLSFPLERDRLVPPALLKVSVKPALDFPEEYKSDGRVPSSQNT